MARWFKTYALAVLLSIVCLGLSALLMRFGEPSWQAFAVVSAPQPSAMISPLAPETTISPVNKADFAIIDERILFHSSRRPYVPAVVPPPPPVPVPTPPPAIRAYSVVGVVVSGDRRLAWLKAPGGGASVRVVEGDLVQGWQVKHIERDRIIFVSGAAEHSLELPKRNSQAPGRPAASGAAR